MLLHTMRRPRCATLKAASSVYCCLSAAVRDGPFVFFKRARTRDYGEFNAKKRLKKIANQQKLCHNMSKRGLYSRPECTGFGKALHSVASDLKVVDLKPNAMPPIVRDFVSSELPVSMTPPYRVISLTHCRTAYICSSIFHTGRVLHMQSL